MEKEKEKNKDKNILIRNRKLNERIKRELKPKILAKGKPDFWFIALVALLAVFGIIMLFSASAPIALSESGNSFSYLSKQIKATIVGLIMCVTLACIDYRILNNKLVRFICIIFIFSSPFIIKFFGYEANFAKRWIKIGSFSLQLSEFVKMFLIILLSSYFAKITEEGKLDSFYKTVVVPACYVLIPAFFIFKFENHFSSAIVLTFISVVIMFTAGLKWKYVLLGLLGGGSAAIYVLKNVFFTGDAGFRSTRIKTFLDPWNDPTGQGYQITQSLMAIGSGGLLGRGIGQSIQKKKYLPYAQNDFIFAIVVEEVGLLGALALIIAFFLLIFFTWRIASRSKDVFGKLIASGIAAFYIIQIFVNIAVAIGLVPVTGMSLPFFSSGGTSIMVTYISVGLLISISRINDYTSYVYRKNMASIKELKEEKNNN